MSHHVTACTEMLNSLHRSFLSFRAVYQTSRGSLRIHSDRSSTCVLAESWMRPTFAFSYHRADFTSPLSLLVPKQQPLLVYLCVFALWFSSERQNPRPSGDWLSGLFIQSSHENHHVQEPTINVSSCRLSYYLLILSTYNYYTSIMWLISNNM